MLTRALLSGLALELLLMLALLALLRGWLHGSVRPRPRRDHGGPR